jgi:predicted CXXCH cytochrome family protein
VEFQPIPADEAARVKNPHDYDGGTLCQRCHTLGETRPIADPIALCAQCHEPRFMKHPFGVPQPTGAEGLPLMAGRKVACHTCHDPHAVKSHPHGLRSEYVPLCRKCHAEDHR